MSNSEEYIFQQHEYVIIGAGISGMQAGLILAQYNKDFVIFQASDQIGGRIATQKLGEILKQQLQKESDYPQWITSNKKTLSIPMDHGGTWICQQHTFMKRIIKDLKIKVFPQYYDGVSIYGQQLGKYQEVRAITQHYQKNVGEVQRLLDRIQNIKQEFKNIKQMEQSNQKKNKFNKFVDTYDTLSVWDFFMSELNDKQLAKQLLNQAQTLQCISLNKISMMQFCDDDSSLELLKLYTGKAQNHIDGMRIQNGMITIPVQMCNKMMGQIKKRRPNFKQEEVLLLNSPVIKIQNDKDKDIKIYIKNSRKVYICKKVLMTVPIAVISQIQITDISESKKLIFDNQEFGNITRVYFVFENAFWRYKYSGYGSFNHSFPFNQTVQLSPANLGCGVIGFVFVGDKYNKWVNQNPEPKKRTQYLKKILADIYLKGDIKSSYLENSFTYTRGFADKPYIKAGYQATTKQQIWKKVNDRGDDYQKSYSDDENNIIYLGSEFAQEFATFLQGAVRLARFKVYKQLGVSDPWTH